MRNLLFCLLFLAPLPALAQEPQLSEFERLKIENLNLKAQLAQLAVKLEQIEAESAVCQLKLSAVEFAKASSQLVKEIEQGHPGYSFDPQTGNFQKKPED